MYPTSQVSTASGQAVPKVALAVSRWVADYLDLLVADLDRQIQAGDGLLEAMAAGCPAQNGAVELSPAPTRPTDC